MLVIMLIFILIVLLILLLDYRNFKKNLVEYLESIEYDEFDDEFDYSSSDLLQLSEEELIKLNNSLQTKIESYPREENYEE